MRKKSFFTYTFFSFSSLIAKLQGKPADSVQDVMERDYKMHLKRGQYTTMSFLARFMPLARVASQQVRGNGINMYL